MVAARKRPPVWFWIATVLLIVWGVVGVAGFHIDLATSRETRAAMSDYDRHFYESRPAWLIGVYGVAVWTGLIGSVLLALRRGFARQVYVLSLIAVVVMFGYMLGTTDLIAVKGLVVAAGFPIVIALIGAFEVWLSGAARRRGWTD